MSFYDEASWVLIPEGIKEDVVYAQKPTNGLGDLAFTRASDATRTNSAGVIERTPWNLVQQSEMFSQSPWNINRISAFGSGSIVNDTIAPNGTLTADYIQQASGQTLTGGVFVQASYILGQSYTLSVYAKKKENNYLRLGFAIGTGGLGLFGNFDLNTGVPGTPDVGVTQTIQDVGNGWYRCSITATSQVTTTANTFIYNSSTLNSSTTTPLQGIYIWGAQLVEGTDAKPYFATTNRQDVPRLDYRNADGTLNSCPRLLLEPQRTNVNIFSEDITNATWEKINVITTNYANVVTSPDGYTNADKLIPDTTSNSYHGIQLSSGRPTLTSGVVYTFSVFAKAQGYDKIRVQNFSQGVRAQFNLTTGTLINQSGTTSTFITPYGNGWYRIGFTYTQSITLGAYWNTLVISTDDNSGNAPIAWTGNGTDSIAVYGHTIEAGAYATTYIPTTTAAVTRLADAASKTGVSSLIGQTEGTLFAEVDVQNLIGAVSRGILVVSDGTTSNRVQFLFTASAANTLRLTLQNSSTLNLSFSISTTGIYKLAVGYTAGGAADFFINGTQVGTTSSIGSFTNTLSIIEVGTVIGGTAQLSDGINQAALFPTRLTNDRLAEITTL